MEYRRLGNTDLDLYQMHWPDRNTNFFGKLGYRHHGATTLDQLRENLGSIEVDLGDEVLAEIEAIHREQPNPAP